MFSLGRNLDLYLILNDKNNVFVLLINWSYVFLFVCILCYFVIKSIDKRHFSQKDSIGKLYVTCYDIVFYAL